MNNIVKSVTQTSDANNLSWLNKLTQNPHISEEELIAIKLEYFDEAPEDWKVHLEKTN